MCGHRGVVISSIKTPECAYLCGGGGVLVVRPNGKLTTNDTCRIIGKSLSTWYLLYEYLKYFQEAS